MKKAFLIGLHAVGATASVLTSVGTFVIGMCHYGENIAIGWGFMTVLALIASVGFSVKVGELKNAK